MKINEVIKCEYGCGQDAKYSPGKGRKKWCCNKSPNSCPSIKEKNRETHIGEKNIFFGKTHTKKVKQKLSEHFSQRYSGENNPFYGKKHSEETKEKMRKNRTKETKKKMSNSHKGLKHNKDTKNKIGKSNTGKNNGNWRGGISKLPYSIDWGSKVKRKVLERDNYECQSPNCSKKYTESFHIHHIDYNKMNCDSTNLITLCISCHMKTNGNREYWQGLFGEI